MAVVYEVLHHISITGVFVFVVSNMAAIGLGHTIGEILAPLQDARLFLGTLSANFVILPLASFGLAVGLRLDNAQAEGLILMGIASGAPFVPKLTELAGGNLRFAVATMGLLTAGTIIYIPPVLPLLMPEVTVSPLTVARPLLLFVLLPFILGLATRAQSENLASWLKLILDRISNATLIPVIILVAALNVDNILHVFGTGGILAALLLVFVGLLVGWLLGGPSHYTKRALALSTGVRNFAVAIVVAEQGFDDPTVAIMVIVAALIALLVVTPLSFLWGRLPPSSLNRHASGNRR
jgi:BASS family bile acid:Na+ symporter